MQALSSCYSMVTQMPACWGAIKQKAKAIPQVLEGPAGRIKAYIQTPVGRMQVYNGLVATAVLGNYILTKDPVSSAEHLFDVGVHVYHVWLSEDSSKLALGSGALLNATRIGVIYMKAVNGTSTIPEILNLVDATVNHTLNFITIGYLYKKRVTAQIKQD